MGLRVGFDAVRALRNSTGLGNYARRLLAGVLGPGCSIEGHLYTPTAPRPEFAGLTQDLGATLHRAGGIWEARGTRSIWRTWRLGRRALADGIELYHGLSHEIPRDLPGTGIPAVVSFLDLLWLRFPGWYRRADRTSYEWRYRWSAEHAQAIVAVSQQTRSDLQALYGVEPSRIVVIPPAADPRFASPVPEPARRDVLFEYQLPERFLLSVGTLEPRKNQGSAIAALAELDPKVTPPLLLVGRDAGSGAELLGLAQRLGVAERVLLRTGIPDVALPALMQSAALFLYPSLFEGFGLPIVEALAAGVPVITSEGSCFPEAGGPDTIYVPATDAVALAREIRRVLDGPALAARMQANGREFARRFDGRVLAARLLKVYEAVRAGGSLPTGQELREEASRCAG